jgi:hypothetical protein
MNALGYAMEKEGINASCRRRVANRLVFGDPGDEYGRICLSG